MERDPARIGTVQDVQGATVSVALDGETASGLTFVDGHPYRVGQVGGFLRIPIGYVDVIGVVTQAGAGAVPERIAQDQPFGYRWLRVELIGEGARGRVFERGLSQLPTFGDPVFLVADSDLERIYGSVASPSKVEIGRVASAEGIPALIDINTLVTRHCAILGSTGAGKSTTVARILGVISDPDRYPSARVLLLDLHGEYTTTFGKQAAVFSVGAGQGTARHALFVPYWALAFDEFLPLTFGDLDDASRAAVRDQVLLLKRETLNRYPAGALRESDLTVDTPISFSVHRLWDHFHRLVNATHTIGPGSPQSKGTEALVLDDRGEAVQPGDPEGVVPPRYQPLEAGQVFSSGSPLNMRRQVDRLASRLRDPRYEFMFSPGPWKPDLDGRVDEDLDSFLGEWLGVLAPVCVLDLSGVPVSITTEIVGVLVRLVYDSMFWARQLAEGGRERPVLFVLEEAHSYLGGEQQSAANSSVRRVVKEGRKYGVGAMIVSQRPSEIDETILSQCGTLIAMRVSNPSDRARIVGSAADNLTGLLAMLPILRTGEAIIVGEAVPLPMRVLVGRPPAGARPASDDPLVVDEGCTRPGGWDRDTESVDFRDVMHTWRQQNPASSRIVIHPDEECERNADE